MANWFTRILGENRSSESRPIRLKVEDLENRLVMYGGDGDDTILPPGTNPPPDLLPAPIVPIFVPGGPGVTL
jgi:hypothetical protein